MARVYLKGMPQLKAKLIKLRTGTLASVKPAMEKAASDLVDMMKRHVPTKSGRLKDSIGWTWGNRPKYSTAIASQNIGDATLTIFAGNTNVRYARTVEFGTAPHIAGGKFAGAQHPGTAKQPFFFTSYRASKKSIKAALRKAILAAVRKAVS